MAFYGNFGNWYKNLKKNGAKIVYKCVKIDFLNFPIFFAKKKNKILAKRNLRGAKKR